MAGPLYSPISYRRASPAEREAVSNGCGPAKLDLKLPQDIMGVPIWEACEIHDWMCNEGEDEGDREWADKVFLMNLRRLIDREGGGMRWVRRVVAWWVWRALRRLGGAAFWEGKDERDPE